MIRSLAKELVHALVFPAIEGVNAALFGLAYLVLRPGARPLTITGRDRVLVIAPHPDDETLGCGGTIALHAKGGDQVQVVIVTDGGNSRAGGLDRNTMIGLREKEARDAIRQLSDRVTLKQLHLREGTWRNLDLIDLLSCVILDWQPTIIYVTSVVDFHPEHVRVARVLAQVLSGLERERTAMLKVRAYELQVPLTPVLANVAANIETTHVSKKAALAQYQTQSGSFLWVNRHERYLQRLYGRRERVEVFWELSPVAYTAIHAKDNRWGSGFRSLRQRPHTDLLAWLVGIVTRRHLGKISLSESNRGY